MSIRIIIVDDHKIFVEGLRASLREQHELAVDVLAEGHSTRETADRLSVSAKTVSTHREHIMRKLGIHSVAGLTKYAIRRGLTSLED